MVHQHFMLADNLTVAENVLLGAEAAHGIGARARARIAELARTVGLRAEPDVLLERLGVADRQRVEILKVLYRGARTVILDEPTAVLVPQEVDELFATLRGMQAEGYTFLFISHKLDEVRAIADSITVIRRGTQRRHGGPAHRHQPRAGRDDGRQRAAGPGHPRVDGDGPGGAARRGPHARRRGGAGRCWRTWTWSCTRVRCWASPASRATGRRSWSRRSWGCGTPAAGRIVLDGRDLSRAGTLARREAGIGYVPEDRTRHGLLASQPLWANRILGHQTRPPRRAARPARAAGPGRRAPRHRAHRRRVRRAHPGRRRAGRRALGREPAEARRRPRAVGRPGAAHRVAPDARRGRRAPRPASGRSCARRGPPGSRCC